jgi:hypothetical protein
LAGTLIAVTITLAILAHFVTAITIRRTLSLFVLAHRRGRVVALSTLSCQPLPTFVAPVAGWLSWLSDASKIEGSISGGGKGDT